LLGFVNFGDVDLLIIGLGTSGVSVGVLEVATGDSAAGFLSRDTVLIDKRIKPINNLVDVDVGVVWELGVDIVGVLINVRHCMVVVSPCVLVGR